MRLVKPKLVGACDGAFLADERAQSKFSQKVAGNSFLFRHPSFECYDGRGKSACSRGAYINAFLNCLEKCFMICSKRLLQK